MTGHVSGLAPPAMQREFDPAIVAGQRRQARRTAVLLGIVALGIFLGFILAVGMRN